MLDEDTAEKPRIPGLHVGWDCNTWDRQIDCVRPSAEAGDSQLVHVPCFLHYHLFVSNASGKVHCVDQSNLQSS
jgi:hypothetical protein